MIASPRAIRSPRAFALLIVVILLAFVVVLLVGLAIYTRIESAVAGNTQRQSQARQNALLGLNVALDQLQIYAGPDQRVTATAASIPHVNPQKAHYTGVWLGNPAAASGPTTTPMTWLVSGTESGVPYPVTMAIPPDRAVQLVGEKSSGIPNSVVVAAQDITFVGVPGAPRGSAATIGRYAWWVGDQGVKAPVAVADPADRVTYAPYESAESRLRLRQQIPLGPGAVDVSGQPVFEPRDLNNAILVADGNVTAHAQIAFLKNSSNEALGVATSREYFHTWSPNSFAVLANTKDGGLRQDLSLQPGLLGPAFAAWADYSAYMEDFAHPMSAATPGISPPYGPDPSHPEPLRRRYRITPPVGPRSVGVAPVLTYFYLLFGVRKATAAAPYTLSLRWAAALWNPYTSALVPEDLRLEIGGLPDAVEFINNATQVVNATASLRERYGDPLKVTLPWSSGTGSPIPSRQSWLPGRVYNWVNLAGAPVQVGGDHPGRFNSRDLGGFADGLTVSVNGTSAVNGNTPLVLRVGSPTALTVKLVRASDGATLATYISPKFDAVPTTSPFPASNNRSQLGFLFRLRESFDSVASPNVWLASEGRDPRSDILTADAFVSVPNGPNPAAYANFITISAPDRFFDRDITRGNSYNEDVPLFELPRSPLLSLGQLQHFFVAGARPFSIGNPWGSSAQVNDIAANALFDRFYFSGLGRATPDLAAGQPLPSPLLTPLRRWSNGASLQAADLATAPEGRSSRHLLQSGAFNLNATRATAWAAVLRGVRFDAARAFTYLNADEATGTGADANPAPLSPASTHFFRFSQSAQEVFKADDAYPQSTTSPTATGPIINTPLFRRGVRSLEPAQTSALAHAIATGIATRQVESGPFLSLEEFLNPAPSLNGQSVIERAVEAAGLNAAVPEFSSQWLTQADIMSALASVLFSRSDTFVIRSYGETVNPATGATEGCAWCEATVQRMPEYFDRSQPEETAPADLNPDNRIYGRRFKVVSFRWLTRFDI